MDRARGKSRGTCRPGDACLFACTCSLSYKLDVTVVTCHPVTRAAPPSPEQRLFDCLFLTSVKWTRTPVSLGSCGYWRGGIGRLFGRRARSVGAYLSVSVRSAALTAVREIFASGKSSSFSHWFHPRRQTQSPERLSLHQFKGPMLCKTHITNLMCL